LQRVDKHNWDAVGMGIADFAGAARNIKPKFLIFREERARK
jgi:hypothetical protein